MNVVELITNPRIRNMTLSDVQFLHPLKIDETQCVVKKWMSVSQQFHILCQKMQNHACILMREMHCKMVILKMTYSSFFGFVQRISYHLNAITPLLMSLDEVKYTHMNDVTILETVFNNFERKLFVMFKAVDLVRTNYQMKSIEEKKENVNKQISEFYTFVRQILIFIDDVKSATLSIRESQEMFTSILLELIEQHKHPPELLLHETNESETHECAVCLNENITKMEMGILQCQHSFCLPCLEQTFTKDNSDESHYRCPLCRENVMQITCHKEKGTIIQKFCRS